MIAAWAARWHIPSAAIADLATILGAATQPDHGPTQPGSEAAVQNAVRMEAARRGMRLWRNNVGSLIDERGVPLRYGIANDSAKINKIVKSSDLIGISSRGQFMALECKRPGWRYTGNEHEKAQEAFLMLVVAMGGYAAFITSPDQLP